MAKIANTIMSCIRNGMEHNTEDIIMPLVISSVTPPQKGHSRNRGLSETGDENETRHETMKQMKQTLILREIKKIGTVYLREEMSKDSE